MLWIWISVKIWVFTSEDGDLLSPAFDMIPFLQTQDLVVAIRL
jgi:hypothetical protein